MNLHILFNKTHIILLITAVILTACSSDDDSGIQVSLPELEFSETEKTVSFMESGEFEAPMIEWNGEEGSLAIMNPSLEGVFINETTGKVNFDGSMPLGVTEIIISAQNSAGETTQSLVLEHVFDAEMAGGWNLDINDQTNFLNDYRFDFYTDGTFDKTQFLSGGNEFSSGTWTREGNFFTMEEPSGVIHEGQLTYDGTNASMTGIWTTDTPSEGSFYLELTD
ncbi:MAG: hypothetical protein GVY05_00405 [Bacteroidetes bacterium]|jgi:hypothetical protein|nr:hypothetical protein [Bacteroidota bacterium]